LFFKNFINFYYAQSTQHCHSPGQVDFSYKNHIKKIFTFAFLIFFYVADFHPMREMKEWKLKVTLTCDQLWFIHLSSHFTYSIEHSKSYCIYSVVSIQSSYTVFSYDSSMLLFVSYFFFGTSQKRFKLIHALHFFYFMSFFPFH